MDATDTATAATAGTGITPRAEHIIVHVAVVLGEHLLRLRGIAEDALAKLRHVSLEDVRASIQRFARELEPQPSRVVIESGVARDTLLDLATDHGADLIVVGTGSRTKLSYALLGSVAAHLMRRAESDVLVVPERTGR
ncbi:hypothetical protein GCM10025762_43300 [Haloechinothrix salitolerans]